MNYAVVETVSESIRNVGYMLVPLNAARTAPAMDADTSPVRPWSFSNIGSTIAAWHIDVPATAYLVNMRGDGAAQSAADAA